jgi:hypothetical protein
MMKLWTLRGGGFRRICVKVKMCRFKTQDKMEKINAEIEVLVLTWLNCVVKHTSLFLCVQHPYYKFLAWLSNCTVPSQVQKRWLFHLQHYGIEFDFDFFLDPPDYSADPSTAWKEILFSNGYWLLVSVILFGGLCMLAMRQIVCNPGKTLPSN